MRITKIIKPGSKIYMIFDKNSEDIKGIDKNGILSLEISKISETDSYFECKNQENPDLLFAIENNIDKYFYTYEDALKSIGFKPKHEPEKDFSKINDQVKGIVEDISSAISEYLPDVLTKYSDKLSPVERELMESILGKKDDKKD
jgi:hypothetical protein